MANFPIPDRFRIVPKRDFGRGPGYWLPNVPGGIGTGSYGYVKRGFVVVDDAMRIVNVMPGACWFRDISEACKGIRALIEANGDSDTFWRLVRE